MANEELIALLQNLQGSGAGRVMNPGLLAQLPSLLDGTAAAATGKPAAGSSIGSTIASTALNTLGGGLTLLPIVSGLLKLFGVGGEKAAPPPLEKFALPPSIQAEAGLSASGGTFLIDRGSGDRIRQLPSQGTSNMSSGNAGTVASSPNGASITVNVNALDSQSFLDRREDIARAVREAMLQSHSLNDVVSEL
jgi:hypothetical protein